MTGYVPHEKDTEYFTLISKSAAQRAKETLGDANAPYCVVLPASAWQIIENEIYSTMLEEFHVSGRVEIETEIPADVRKAAQEAMAQWWVTREGYDAFGTHVPQELPLFIARAIMAERERHDEAISVMRQTIREVRHAQNSGASWYTKGSAGLYQQVRMWLDKASVEINKIRAPE